MRNQKEPKEKKDKSDKKEVRHYDDGIASVLRKPVIYEELRQFGIRKLSKNLVI